jgi:hypothetical protein
MAQTRHLAASWLTALACLAFCAYGVGQTGRPPYRQSAQADQAQPQKPSPALASSSPSTSPLPPPSTATAPSLLDHPAQPAKVTLASGKLTVQADNSSLSGILHQVSEASGMKVEGLQAGSNGDQRIFGNYGPAAPRDVLSELLNGSGFNVIMLGETSAGLPRELTLTPRSSGGVLNPQPNSANAMRNDDNDEPIQATQYPDEQEPVPQQVAPGAPNRVRTPPEMLQELQRMRDQQQQQQPQEIDPQPN